MSTPDTGSTNPADPTAGGRKPTEDELRAAYEAEIKRIRVEQVVLEQVVTLINLGMRRTGLAPGTEDERDLEQVRLAIEAIRVQLALIEQITPDQVGQIRDALSQLQLAFVRLGGSPSPEAAASADPGAAGRAGAGTAGPPPAGARPAGAPAGPGATEPPSSDRPDETGPAPRSSRLWIPGQ